MERQYSGETVQWRDSTVERPRTLDRQYRVQWIGSAVDRQYSDSIGLDYLTHN